MVAELTALRDQIDEVDKALLSLLAKRLELVAEVGEVKSQYGPVSYTHLRAHETRHDLVCRLLLEKKKKKKT